MYSIDGEGAGYLLVDDFLQVLTSRDLGFQLEENEQAYIANQVMLAALYTHTHKHTQPLSRIHVCQYCMYKYTNIYVGCISIFHALFSK